MLLDRSSSIRIAGALVCFLGGPLLGWACGRGAPAGNGASTGSSSAPGNGSSTGSADASSSGNGPDSSSGSSSGGNGPGDDASGHSSEAASSESDSGTAVTGDASTAPDGGVANWPQAAGPNGTWLVNAANAPTSWSVAANQNIVWHQPLPNEGQGGIAVWGDTLFLETFPPGVALSSLDVVGHAIDKSTGKIKWSTPVMHGNGYLQASLLASSWSDATSWTPITDGQYVWFFNAAGHMGCWPVSGGNAVWERDFPGQRAIYPFNRNHEPILYGNSIIILSELGMGDPPPKVDGWEYLHGIDKMTGKTLWVADDASTFYNTAVMGTLPNGMPAVLHGRGGEHGAPERPVGLSMTSLAPGSEGKMLWQFQANSGEALYNSSWDGKYAYWFTVSPNETMQVIDAAN